MVLPFCFLYWTRNFPIVVDRLLVVSMFSWGLLFFSWNLEVIFMFQVLSRNGLDCPDLETLTIKDQALPIDSEHYLEL